MRKSRFFLLNSFFEHFLKVHARSTISNFGRFFLFLEKHGSPVVSFEPKITGNVFLLNKAYGKI